MTHLLYGVVATILPFLLRTRNTQRLSILNYHRVMLKPDPMRPSEPTVAQFEWQMELLAKYFNPLSLSDALTRMELNDLPAKAVCVTFDDGYADNEALALPVLQRLGIPATVFVTTGYLNGGRMWNDTIIEALRLMKGQSADLSEIGLGVHDISNQGGRAVAARAIIEEIKHWTPERRSHAVNVVEGLDMEGVLPTNLMLTDDQLVNLSANDIDIGAHTETHPILATLNLAQSKQEIKSPKAELEMLIKKPVKHFAYPNGRPEADYKIEHRDLAELAGYSSAVSTQWGVVSKNSDRWQLPRFTPWDKKPLKFLIRLLLNFRHPV